LPLHHEGNVSVHVAHVDGLQLELVDKERQGLGGDKGREGGAYANVLDIEVKEGEEDGDGLLLEPGEGEGEGQAVDINLQGLGEFRGDDDGTVGVVALAHIEEPGEAGLSQGAKVLGVEAVFATAEGQDHRVRRHLLRQLAVVVALTLRAIAAPDEEDVREFAGLGGIEDLVGNLRL